MKLGRSDKEATGSQQATHRFSWDGFSMNVPEAWNLAQYAFDRHKGSIRLEDDEAIRLELEWTRPAKPVDPRVVRERYDKQAKGLVSAADAVEPLASLPDGWSAFEHVMPEERCLVTAYWLARGGKFLAFLKLHAQGEGPRKPVRQLRELAGSFRLNGEPTVPWEFYDVSWRLDRRFRLTGTGFEAGRKLAVFEWRLRRLHLWQFSLADLVLKGRTLGEWAAGFLNGYKGIHGVTFTADGDEGVTTKRKRQYPLGHYEEIGRWCRRYRVQCRRLPEKNALGLWVFNYRNERDLEMVKTVSLG